MTLPRHPAVHLERALAGGSSWPIVVRDDAGERWLVKLRGNAHGAAPLCAATRNPQWGQATNMGLFNHAGAHAVSRAAAYP